MARGKMGSKGLLALSDDPASKGLHSRVNENITVQRSITLRNLCLYQRYKFEV